MSRMFGLIVVLIVLGGVPDPAHAQTTMPDYYDMESDGYSGYFSGYQTHGGFGLGYSQAATAGALMMDQFGMQYRLPDVAPAPTVAAPRARAGRARAGTRRAAAPSQYPLPTGSLYWPAANGVILYSPAMRYRAYGAGYGRSPYGSVDYSTMYKGWLLSY